MGVVFRQSLKGTIVNLLGAGIGFLTTFFVATKLLQPDEIGLTRVLIESGTLVAGYALLATNSSAVRYYPHFRTADGRDGGFFRLLMRIVVVGLLFFGGLYLLFREPLTNYFTQSGAESDLFGRYYYVVLPLMIFILFQTVLEVYCSLRQRIVLPKLSREVVLRLLLLLVYVAYGFGWVSFGLFIGGFVVAYGLMMLLTLLYSYRIAPQAVVAPIAPIPSGLKRDFCNYTLFTVLSAMGSAIVQRLDLFMVSAELGMASAGVYTIAFYVVAVIEMPSRSLSAMSAPFASEAIHSGDSTRLNRIYREVSTHQLLVGAILLLAIWVNIDLFFWLIPNGVIYATGKWVVLFLGLGKLVDLSFSFGNSILRYSKHYFWTLPYTAVVVVVTILLNLYMIDRWGMVGASIATMITLVVSYAFQQVVLWWKMGVSPISWEMLRIWSLFILLMGLNTLVVWLLPSSSNILLDSVWRSLVIGIFGCLLLHRLEAFRGMMRKLRALFAREK